MSAPTTATAEAPSRGRRRMGIPLAAALIVGSGFAAVASPGAAMADGTPQAGQLVAWGFSGDGQSIIPAAAQDGVVAVDASRHHVLAIRQNGSVVAWGSDSHGQTDVPAAANSGVTAVAAGNLFSLALTADGSVIGWGYDNSGQVDVPEAAESGVTAIAAGENHSLALRSDGSVVAWGFDLSGETSVPAAAQSGVTAIAAGSRYSLALRADGSVIGWGDDTFHVVGAIPAAAGSGVIAIAAGTGHALALKADGSVIGWGSNWAGQAAPPAAAQSGVSAISAGDAYSLALKSDGSVISWGSTADGRSVLPPSVARGVTAITAGAATGFAISSVPVITTQPASTVISTGGVASLSASATGVPAPTVRWQKAARGSSTFADIPGATATGYTTGPLVPADSGVRYRAVFTNSGGQVASDPATVTVQISAPSVPAPIGTVGTAYSFAIPVPAAPVTVTTTSGSVPLGLSLNTDGTITGTPTTAGSWSITVTASSPYGRTTQTQEVSINPATTGQAAVVTAPASVQPGASESPNIQVFGEKYNQTLASPLTIGGTTIPAGTKINSYYVHADAIGNENIAHLFTGSVAFGSKILAVASTTTDLQASNSLLGKPGVAYSTSTDQGLEYDDTATASGTVGAIDLAFNVYNSADAVRVITIGH